MKFRAKIAGLSLAAFLTAGLCGSPARAQAPSVVDPIIIDTAVPIIANIAQITVRAKGNDMSLETFSLSSQAAAEMQSVVDKGGFQYGDKVTVYYDPTSKQALKVKGKPSKPL